MCARFTVLSAPPIAAAIAGCVIPRSRSNTIWMRWRCASGIPVQRRFQLSNPALATFDHLFPRNQTVTGNHIMPTRIRHQITGKPSIQSSLAGGALGKPGEAWGSLP
jgi:hypothetical protein